MELSIVWAAVTASASGLLLAGAVFVVLSLVYRLLRPLAEALSPRFCRLRLRLVLSAARRRSRREVPPLGVEGLVYGLPAHTGGYCRQLALVYPDRVVLRRRRSDVVVPFSDLVSVTVESRMLHLLDVSGTLHPVFFPREELLPLFAAELDRAFRSVSSAPVVFVPAQRVPLPVRVDAPTS